MTGVRVDPATLPDTIMPPLLAYQNRRRSFAAALEVLITDPQVIKRLAFARYDRDSGSHWLHDGDGAAGWAAESSQFRDLYVGQARQDLRAAFGATETEA